MSNIWFTADTHCTHENIIRFCPRTRLPNPVHRAELEAFGHGDLDPETRRARKEWLRARAREMDQTMIDQWRRLVQPDDTVYHLGDVFFCGHERAREILDQLTGRIHLVLGNHDQVIRKNHDIQRRFASVQEYLDIKIDGQHVVMSHYPMLRWNRAHYGALMLYGHVHGDLDGDDRGRTMDVGVDSRPGGVEPSAGAMGLWSWEDVRDLLLARPVTAHH